jgi:hypothetical protein
VNRSGIRLWILNWRTSKGPKRDPRLSAIVDRLTYYGTTIETGTEPHRLAHAKARQAANGPKAPRRPPGHEPRSTPEASHQQSAPAAE